MSRVAINSPNAPNPRAANGQALYNQAIVANGFVFCSGQLPKGPDGKLVAGTVQDRTKQCISNLRAVLEAAGSSLESVIEVNVFLSNIDDFPAMNEEYGKYWGNTKPARTCVAVKTLPENSDVEIKCVGLVN